MSDMQNDNLIDGMHLLVDALLKNNVTTIYGVAGIPITDLARHAQEMGIKYVGFRHEQSAGHAAAIAGYLTQKPGICLTVSGPGFLNGLVALANATVNGFPMIQISGSSNRSIIDLQQGDYEELDQMAIAKPLVKASLRINRPEDIGIALARALRIATSGRPGGVYLDVTSAMLATAIAKDIAAETIFKVENITPKQLPNPSSLDKALEILQGAKNPLILLGKGAAYAQADEAIKEFIEQTKIPYLPMSMAKGLLPDDHELCAAAARSLVLSQSDVVVLVGARLNWLLQHGKGKHWNPNAKLIQIDISPNEIDSNRQIHAPIVADIKSAIQMMLARLPDYAIPVNQEWLQAIKTDKQKNSSKLQAKLNADTNPLNFFNALKVIKEITDEHQDIYLVNEGANTLDDTRNVIDMYYPRRRLDCGTWGIMGIGTGFSIAAAVEGKKPVLAIQGDSAFGFDGMELETICRYKLPITIVIFNNNGIYRGDHVDLSGAGDPSPTSLTKNARYDKVIEAFGGIPFNVSTQNELKAALKEALTSGKPTLINCAIDPAAGTESGHISALNPKTIVATK